MNPFIAELIGTALLLMMGCGVVANLTLNKTKATGFNWLANTTAWALGVFISITISGPYSGAHFSPAITIGMAIQGCFPWSNVFPYIVAQMLGGALGAFLVWLLYKDHFDQTTDDPGKLLGIFCTSPAIKNHPRNFFVEVVATFVMMFVVLHQTGAELTLKGDEGTLPIGLGSIGALPVALTVWSIGLSLGGLTGYAINPARDLGPRIMHAILPLKGKGSSEWDYAWIPVIAPIIGAALAALAYNWLQA